MIKYVEWPSYKCPFPYIAGNQLRDLKEYTRQFPADELNDEMSMGSFLNRVSPNSLKGSLEGYFSNNDIKSPKDAWELLVQKLSDDDGYTLYPLGHLIGKSKNNMNIERLLELIDARSEMKKPYNVYFMKGRILYVTKL